MKKIMLVIMMLLVVSLTGCDWWNFYNYGLLEDIKVFNENGEEIIGEFKDSYLLEYDLSYKLSADLPSKSKLNSPAPQDLYYVVDVEEGMNLIFQFKIQLNNTYDFYKIRINNIDYLFEDAYDYVIDGNNMTVDFLIENVSPEKIVYSINGLYFIGKTNEKIVSGSTNIEGRTFLAGIYLNFPEDE